MWLMPDGIKQQKKVGRSGDRTRDLLTDSQTLYQLSYATISEMSYLLIPANFYILYGV